MEKGQADGAERGVQVKGGERGKRSIEQLEGMVLNRRGEYLTTKEKRNDEANDGCKLGAKLLWQHAYENFHLSREN